MVHSLKMFIRLVLIISQALKLDSNETVKSWQKGFMTLATQGLHPMLETLSESPETDEGG